VNIAIESRITDVLTVKIYLSRRKQLQLTNNLKEHFMNGLLFVRFFYFG